MTRAEIISIGTELLLGDVIDTNTSYIAGKLRQNGIDLLRTIMIGDNAARIAEQVKNSLISADIVITTGGLGPTIDDATREAIALAFEVPLEFHNELWECISARFTSRGLIPTKNNQRQSYLPHGAIAIDNPVGTAPAFWIPSSNKMVVCLPGVPDEMKTILERSVLPLLTERYALQEFLLTRTLHVCCMGESAIDELIAEFETLSNPTVGLCAHPGIVDIRITAKSRSFMEAEIMIEEVANKIRTSLSGVIYGEDEFSLIDAIKNALQVINQNVTIRAFAFSQMHLNDLIEAKLPRLDLLTIIDQVEFDAFIRVPVIEPTFLFALTSSNSGLSLDLYLKTKDNCFHTQRSYLGPPAQGDNWVINTTHGYLWNSLNQIIMETK